MNTYKVYFSNNDTVIIAAEDFEIKLPKNGGQRRLVFTVKDRNIAVFNWAKIVGVECLWEKRKSVEHAVSGFGLKKKIDICQRCPLRLLEV